MYIYIYIIHIYIYHRTGDLQPVANFTDYRLIGEAWTPGPEYLSDVRLSVCYHPFACQCAVETKTSAGSWCGTCWLGDDARGDVCICAYIYRYTRYTYICTIYIHM